MAEMAKKVADKAIDSVKDAVKTTISKGKEVIQDTWNAVKESKLNPLNWF